MARGTAMVLIEGRAEVGAWSEPCPAECPNGCDRRDLEGERERDYDRLCLRCLTWTWDRPPLSEADEALRVQRLRRQAADEHRKREAAEFQETKKRSREKAARTRRINAAIKAAEKAAREVELAYRASLGTDQAFAFERSGRDREFTEAEARASRELADTTKGS